MECEKTPRAGHNIDRDRSFWLSVGHMRFLKLRRRFQYEFAQKWNISQNNHLPGEDYGVYHDSWDLVVGFFKQTHGFASYSASGAPICLLSLNCMVRAFSTVLCLLCYVCDWYQGS
jgi:hypothetical protein